MNEEKQKENSGSDDLTLALLVANIAAIAALYAIVKISKKKFFLTLESIHRAYSEVMRPEDYQE